MATRLTSVVCATAAVAWSVALVAVFFLVPVYSTEDSEGSCDAAGNCTSTAHAGGASLVDENGTWVLWIAVALILCAVVAWIGLHRQCKTGSEVGAVVAWTLAIVILLVSLVSFGLWIFMLPLAILMIVAAATCRGPDAHRV